ncbi:MAG: DUF421 domain-containing protein, partial [Phycisphaerales bacterium]
WTALARVVLVGVPSYAALMVLLRVSGKRTLSKMNAFDFVVTVALGSTLANILLSAQVSLAEGVLALAMLIGLQFVVAFAASRWDAIDGLVKAEPVMVFHRGRFLRSAMRRERVTEPEILAAVRGANLASTDLVEAVVLETAGEFSVVQRPPEHDRSDSDALRGVRLDSDFGE